MVPDCGLEPHAGVAMTTDSTRAVGSYGKALGST